MFKLFYSRHTKKQLTMVEMIAIIMVVVLLLGILVPKLVRYVRQAKEVTLYRDIDVLERAILMYNIDYNDLPLLEKVELEEGDPLLVAIQALGDTGQELYKVDLEKTKPYHTKLKHGYGKYNNDYFIFSKETNRVYYAHGITNVEGEIVYSTGEEPFRNIYLEDIPLSAFRINYIDVEKATIKGEVLENENLQIVLNDKEVPIKYEGFVTASKLTKNIHAAEKRYKKFSAKIELLKYQENKLKIKSIKRTRVYIIKYGEFVGLEYRPFNDNITTKLSKEQTFPTTTEQSSPSNTGTSYKTYSLNNSSVSYSGEWYGSSTITPYTSTKNASIQLPFNGTGVDVYVYKGLNYSKNIAVYIDGKQYPSIDASKGSSGYVQIARNLTKGNHVLKLVNMDNNLMKIGQLKVYQDYTQVKKPSITLSLVDGVVRIQLNSAYLGMQKYVIYRSKTPNIDTETAIAYDVIEADNIVTRKNVDYFAGQYMNYYDTIYNNETYYYKVVGIDSGGYKWESNEKSITMPIPLTYSARSRRDYNNWRFYGDWYSSGTRYYTIQSGSYVKIPFIGTGIDVEFNLNSAYSQNVEIKVDGKTYPSINTSLNGNTFRFVKIARNLPYGRHTLVIKNLDKNNKKIEIDRIRVYFGEVQVKQTNLSVYYGDGLTRLTIYNDGLGMEKYYIYKSTTPNINIEEAEPIFVIKGNEIINKENIKYYPEGRIEYYDTVNQAGYIYYKVVGVDGGKNKWISYERSVNVPNVIYYYNTTKRENNEWIFEGNWYNKTTNNPYTTSKDSVVTIPFKGTGIDIYIYKHPNYSKNIEVWIDNVQYPSIKADYGASNYVQIARNLEYGNHTLKLVNKEDKMLKLWAIGVHLAEDKYLQPYFTVYINNGMSVITMSNKSALGMEKYLIYRDTKSFTNSDIEQMEPVKVIEKDITIKDRNVTYNPGYHFVFRDTLYEYARYYYRIVGIDGKGQKWISGEKSVMMSNPLVYSNTSTRNEEDWIFNGTWNGTTSSNPYTYEQNASVEIPFTGIGLDIYLYKGNNHSNNIEVWVDGEQYPSIRANYGGSTYVQIVRNLEYGKHKVKLINKDSKKLHIGNIKVYLTQTDISTNSLGLYLENGAVRLTLTGQLGMKKFEVYRSTDPNVPLTEENLIQTIEKSDTVSGKYHMYINSGYNFNWYDTLYDHNKYYYKVIGIDAAGNQWKSTIRNITMPKPLTYDENSKRENNDWKFTGWYNKLYTNEKDSVLEIPFRGTGIDAYIHKSGIYTGNVEVWIDDVQYPSISAKNGNNIVPIARNLEYGDHVLKLINKEDKYFRLDYIRVYMTEENISLTFSITEDNGTMRLTIPSSSLGMQKYEIYRSKEPNIDIENSISIMTISKDNIINNKKINYVSGSCIYIYDTVYDADKYYYKIVGIDAAGNKYISVERSLAMNHPLTYDKNSLRDNNNWIFTGNWSWLDRTYPYTTSLNSTVEIPFRGTGIDIYVYKHPIYSKNIEVWIDDVQYPSIRADYGSNGYVQIARNLKYGDHTLKLINKNDGTLKIGRIRVYMLPTEVINPTLTVAEDNGTARLILSKNGLGMKEYYIFRSKKTNIDVNNETPYKTIKENSMIAINNLYYNAGYELRYCDTLFDHETYYYKVLGIDAAGNKWISNEVNIAMSKPLTYNNISKREKNNWRFFGTWWNTNDKYYPYPNTRYLDASVEIPFTGTGINIYIDKYYSYSDNIEVYVDGVQYPSFKANYGADGYVQIVKNLPYGDHVVKLVNKSSGHLRIGNIQVYMNDIEVTNPTISVSETNGLTKIMLNDSKYLGMKEYRIYRSTEPNIDVKNSTPIFVIDKQDTQNLKKVQYNAGYYLTYYDTLYDTKTYYYKLEGIDGREQSWISNEVEFKLPDPIKYYNSTVRDNNWQFIGTWGNTSSSNPYTNYKDAEVRIPFVGTGIDISIYSASDRTRDIEVWVDDVQYPNINANTGGNHYWKEIKIARNLEYGNHVLRLINKDNRQFNINYIKVYLNDTEVTVPSISLTPLTNGFIRLNYYNDGFGMEKIEIYRSKTPNINIETATPIYTIEKTKTRHTNPIVKYYMSNRIEYYDTIYDTDTYYYVAVGIDARGNKWISQEKSAKIQNPIYYFNITPRNDNNWVFEGTWEETTTSTPYTTEPDAYVEIPFKGTGFSIYMYKNYNYSDDVEVWVDGVKYPSIRNDVGLSTFVHIVKNLPYGNHKVKLVNRDNGKLQIGAIKVFMDYMQPQNITLNVSEQAGQAKLRMDENAVGMTKYLIYRNENSNIDTNTMSPYDTIYQDNFVTTRKIANYENALEYFDKNVLPNKTYYYKVVGIDAAGNKWESNVSEGFTLPSYVEYYNTTLRDKDDDDWVFYGTWIGKDTSNTPYTNSSGHYVDIKFVGTGIDVYNYKYYYSYSYRCYYWRWRTCYSTTGNTNKVEAYIDGQYIRSWSNYNNNNGWESVIRDLPYGEHTLRLVNRDNKKFQIGQIRIYK